MVVLVVVVVEEFASFHPLLWARPCSNTSGALEMTGSSQGRRQPSCEWCRGWVGWWVGGILLLWPKGNKQLWTTCAKVRREWKEGGSKGGKKWERGSRSCLLRSSLLCYFLGCWSEIDCWILSFFFWHLFAFIALHTGLLRKQKQRTDRRD